MAKPKIKSADDPSTLFDSPDDVVVVNSAVSLSQSSPHTYPEVAAPSISRVAEGDGTVSLGQSGEHAFLQIASQATPGELTSLAEDEFCPRQITFTIPGKAGVQVTATENDGKIDFVVDVLEGGKHSGDLRGLFFHFDEAKLGGLQITGGDDLITGTQIKANQVIDLGQGANMHGKADPFDVGIAFGTPGKGKDVVDGPVHFSLSNAGNNLTLDDIAHLQFGARLTSSGDKITTFAPAAPDAHDDTAATHEDTPVTIKVLANDTDADGDKLTITSVHLDSGAHGTVAIATDGQSIIYTPDKDYAGTNFDPNSVDATFEYCISDGHGGEDSAKVDVHVIPIADHPTITFDVLTPEANDPINMVRLKVTAAQSDADGSEFIDRIEFGALPAGVTMITDGELNPAGQPDSVTEFVQLMLPTAQAVNFQDINFDLNVTAYAQEEGSGDPDQASATAAKHIAVDFTHNETHQIFDAVEQSIWTTGSGAPFTRDKFIGPDIPFDESVTFITPTIPPLPVTASVEGHFKVGLQVNVTFDGGAITAHLPYDITIDTTYNETTDSLLIQTGAALALGSNFSTTGPEGSIDVAFIVDFLAKIGLEDGIAGIVGIDKTFAFQPDPLHLIDFSGTSPDLPFTVPLPAGLSINLDWPHLSGGSTGQSGSQILGEASSNNFIQLNLDVDFAAAQLFPLFAPIEAVLDPDPTSETNFELFDLDINAGANLIQKFVLDALTLGGTLTFENNQTKDFLVGEDIPIIHNASSLDGPDLDHTIDFALVMKPEATLDNETSVGLNVGGQLGLLKNIPVIDDSLFDEGLTIPVASIPVYDTDPFQLNFNTQTYDFVV
jgi:Cadherin-like domain